MWNNPSREWMYNRIDPYTNHIAADYLAGVEAFISYASHVEDRKGRFLCPCVVCQNSKSVKAVTVSSHLLSRGFMPNYYVWYEHGEDYNVVGEGTSNYADNTDYTSNYADNTDYTSNVNEPIGFHGENIFAGMVNDAFHGSVPYNEYHEHESGNDHVHEEPTQEAKRFYDMLAAANTPLYDGCREGQSQLSLAARFMNNKMRSWGIASSAENQDIRRVKEEQEYHSVRCDGFNPFGMSKNHSLWPVILTPYNLPPDMCMKSEYLFLTILNSGPNHPRASLDVFFQPLIDELQDLWHNGVEAYDVSLDQNFNLKAVLLWTISDFPAYGMLSGWTTHGRLSCPICMEDTNAFWLPGGRKTCWFDCHRRFLPVNHSLRKDKTHFLKGKGVKEYPPQSLTGEQVLYERIRTAEPPMTSDCGGNGHEKKVDGYGQWHNWHKESILWQLPYWVDLNLRHNLDVMHIEKNVLDNIMYTVMNVKDKSKDTVRSRIDVSRFCDRPELHVDDQGKAPFPIWRLSAKAKKSLLEWVKSEVKFPDGYVADLASCADINAGKFSGMKSHDSHVLGQASMMQVMFQYILYRFRIYSLNVLEAQIRYDSPELSDDEVLLKRDEDFPMWIRQYVLAMKSQETFPPWVHDIVECPENKVTSWPMYFTRGYMFHTKTHGRTKKTMNYGVCVRGQNYSDVAEEDDFFGTVENIIELQYPGFVNLKITLFYCEWYDPTVGKGVRIGNGGILDVQPSQKYRKYEPFILGSQADQVCYLSYPYTKRPRKSWLTVCKVNPRNVIQGKFSDTDLVILQQTVDDATPTIVEEVIVDTLVDGNHQDEHIDFDIEDAEPEDEFLCKSSRGRGGGATTRRVAAGGGQTSRQEAAGRGQTSRQEAAGGGATTRRVAAGGGQALPQEAVGGGETSRPVASRGRVRTFVGHRPPVTASGVGTSSNASNPSLASQSATQSQPLPEHDANHQVLPENEDLEEEEIDDVGQEDDEENPNPGEDYQDMLDRLLALPGREHLPRLSVHPIPNVETFWFNRQKGVLSRAISRIFRRKFDGPYYSWKVTPINIQERYFRTFAREFNWDTGITGLVKQGFLVIAQKRMKGIVSQVRTKGVQPTWIRFTLWTEMQNFWKTADAIERSENASQCRNSDRGGLGVHKHLAGQKSFIQVHQEMEEELGRPVSLGEVFMRTHTRADGPFVDQKSEQVAEAYKKTVEERLAELEEDVQDASEISSEHSMHPRELSIDEMNDIFLKSRSWIEAREAGAAALREVINIFGPQIPMCFGSLVCTHTDDQGNPYGLGSLVETLHKGKRKESYASSSSTVTVVELQEQLRRKISNQDAENARRDEEHRKSQARIASLEKLILFMKDKDPDLAAFMSTSPLLEPEVLIPPTTTTTTLPATTGAAVQPAGHTTGTTPTSPLSTASNQ
ncbi:Transposase-associated domain [Arabidopsis thaliana x Arabidopsis arenosa]|uniref:Transposase-associated domain n=1 Tax=Arabidopsis thaliana x Arabidopsis arenosa TaxID=1240361 RepID=A0A8T1ZJ81_9BRAS|nr:Transposase-associated domain [Arabidopsis thaliana x Arabidopsis arenosa]